MNGSVLNTSLAARRNYGGDGGDAVSLHGGGGGGAGGYGGTGFSNGGDGADADNTGIQNGRQGSGAGVNVYLVIHFHRQQLLVVQ